MLSPLAKSFRCVPPLVKNVGRVADCRGSDGRALGVHSESLKL